MADYRHRGPLKTIAAATALLMAVAIGAYVIWTLLEPLLPSLLGISLVALVAFALLRRR
jgi:hypothetical protein